MYSITFPDSKLRNPQEEQVRMEKLLAMQHKTLLMSKAELGQSGMLLQMHGHSCLCCLWGRGFKTWGSSKWEGISTPAKAGEVPG